MTGVEVRDSIAGDRPAIETLYPEAFPKEDLAPLVRKLLRERPAPLSLVAARGAKLVGHVVFTECRVAGSREKLALLGPLAVAPDAQRRGVGSALVEAGLARLAREGVDRVFVLGDPAYYRRFGFEIERSTKPPHAIPDRWLDAWRSKGLAHSAPSPAGALDVPPAWSEPSLWAP